MKKQTLNLFVGATLCSLFFAPCSSTAQVPSYVPTNGLVGWWPFNGNANDESGNGNNGTVNGATLTTDRFGIVNNAYSYDGNDWIEIMSNQAFNFGIGSFTIGCWATREGVNNFQHLVTRNYIPYWPNATWNFALRYELDGLAFFGAQNTTTSNGVTSISGLSNLSNWNNIVGIYDASSQTISIYLNGNLMVSAATNSNPQTYDTNGSTYFGVEHPTTVMPSGPNYLTGKLDDIGIWNRALTACEIADLYNSQLGSLNTSSTQTQSAMDSYTWQVNGQTYTQSGSYTAVIPNAAGCDSTITLNLTLGFTGIEDLQFNPSKKLLKITDLNGKETHFRKNTVLVFIYEDGTIERVFEAE